MSFTFKSINGSLKMGKTPTVTQIDNVTTSGVNFEYINASEIVLKTAKYPGILHTDSTGKVSSSPLVAGDIADRAVTKEKIADSIVLTGIPTAPTAANSTNSKQIATTEYVKNIISDLMGGVGGSLDTLQELAAALQDNTNLSNTILENISTKVSLTANETIEGIKTFASSATPIFKSLTTPGVVHNDSDGKLSTSLVALSDIETDLRSKVQYLIDISDIETGLMSKVQYLIDMYNNKQTTSEPAAFVHVTPLTNSDNNGLLFYDPKNNHAVAYKVTNGVRYIIESVDKITSNFIYLPLITKEGVTYSITNKSGQTIIISTENSEVLMYSCFVAPEGDDAFEVENHRTLDVYSMIVKDKDSTNPNDVIKSWQARFE